MFQKHFLDKVAVHMCEYILKFTITISVPFGITKYFVHNLCSISIKVNLALSQNQTGLALIAVLTVSTLNFYGSVLILEYPLTSERI